MANQRYLDDVIITTDASGNGMGYSSTEVARLVAIQYIKTDYTDGVDLVASLERSGITLITAGDINASTVMYPAHALTVIGIATEVAYETFPIPEDRVVLTITNGGNTKTGTFRLIVE